MIAAVDAATAPPPQARPNESLTVTNKIDSGVVRAEGKLGGERPGEAVTASTRPAEKDANDRDSRAQAENDNQPGGQVDLSA